MTRLQRIARTVVSGIFVSAAGPAFAQGADPVDDAHVAGLEEIIVTAQKRSENVQDVPIAVNAIRGDLLTRSGVGGLEDVKQLSPSFNFRPSVAGNLASIRGVSGDFSGPSNESPIAVNFDDVYVGTDSAYFYPFVAVERIDVLSGPQGTLFGRNATGGVVNIVLKQPSHETSGQFSLGYGNYNTFTAETYVTGGMSDTIAANFAASIRHQDTGYGKNLLTGLEVGQYNSKAVRGSLAWEPSSAAKVRFSADYNKYDGSTFGGHVLFGRANNSDTIPEGGPQDVNSNVPPVTKTEGYGFSLHISQDLGFADLVSITGYRNVNKYSETDIDGGPNQSLQIFNDERNRQISQELRLDSKGSGPLKWVAGLYYYNYSGGYRPTNLTSSLGTISTISNTLTTKAYAVFAQGSYALTPATNLTLGARYSWEDRTAEGSGIEVHGAPPAVPVVYPLKNLHEERPTWRVSIDHHFTNDLMVYASYNRGFKSGGFSAISLGAAPFLSEKIDSYEIGMKSELLDHRLRFNIAAFYYKYDNMQVTDVRTGVPITTNAGAATIKGLEAQLTAVLGEGFTVDAGFALTDAKYDRYLGANCIAFDPSASSLTTPENVPCDASGRGLLRTPRYSFTITPHYTFEMGRFTGDLTVSYYYASGQDLVFTDSPLLKPGPRNTLNTSFTLGLPGGAASITLWASNLLDENQLSFISVPPLIPPVGPFPPAGALSGHGFGSFSLPPRTYGVKLNFKF